MDAEKFLGAIFSDEDLVKNLQMLNPKCWDSSSYVQRKEFFKKILNVVNKVDKTCPCVIKIKDFEDDFIVPVIFDEDCVYIKKSFFYKVKNPYNILTNLVFEYFSNYYFSTAFIEYQCDKVIDERQHIMNVNASYSPFRKWDNVIKEGEDDYYNQPIVYYSNIEMLKVLYQISKYMNKKYGMDVYLQKMIDSLAMEKRNFKDKEKLMKEVYKKMETRYNESFYKECYALEKMENVYMNLDNLQELSDLNFYEYFNSYMLFNYTERDRTDLYREFARRFLKGYSKIDELVNSIYIGEIDKYGTGLIVNGVFYGESVDMELYRLVDLLMEYKFENNLFDELDVSDEFKESVIQSYNYIKENKETNKDSFESTKNWHYHNYVVGIMKKKVFNYYKKLIVKSIKESGLILNEGTPSLADYNMVSSDVILEFKYDFDSEELNKPINDFIKKFHKGGRK